jgi:hypothetical protein
MKVKCAEAIKHLASWTPTIIVPSLAPIVGNGGEQGMPLWIARLVIARLVLVDSVSALLYVAPLADPYL